MISIRYVNDTNLLRQDRGEQDDNNYDARGEEKFGFSGKFYS